MQKVYQRKRLGGAGELILRRRAESMVGGVAVAGLGIIGLIAIYPMVYNDANATEDIAVHSDSPVPSTLSVALSPTIDLELTPSMTTASTFASSSATLRVATNSLSGYSVYIKSKNTNLISTDTSHHATIQPLASSMSQEAFSSIVGNYWGLRIGNGNYSPLPTSYTTAQISTDNVNLNEVDTYNLDLGVSITGSLPAGQYTGEIIVSAVANPTAITNLLQLNYMQDMTTPICESTPLNDKTEAGKRLIDIRDGKAYWVAKLKDGNCWMTQNLDLDLSTKKTLTSSDTDLNSVSSWTPEHDTSRQVPEKVDNPSQTEDLSWDMGDYVLATPQRGAICSSPSSTNQYDSVKTGETLAQCTDFQDVQGWAPYWVSKVTTNGWNGKQNLYVAANAEDKTYDAHYLIGNYYQWNAATAGSGKKTDTENVDSDKLVDAEDSICPKGWKLPVAGRNTTADAGWPLDHEDSFYKLLRAYGYPETGSSTTDSSLASTKWIANNGNAYTGTTGTGKVRLDGSPVYFVRSGNIYIPYGSIRYAGMFAYARSSTAYRDSNQSTFMLLVGAVNIYPSGTEQRHRGLSVRCLAR